ncbi:VCBS repeat-containing protein [Echinicola sediminis]
MQYLTNKLNRLSLFTLLVSATLVSCERSAEFGAADKLFTEVSPRHSGIEFANTLSENDSINYFNYMYIYMGGGVAIGDLNKDGLPDVYLTGNMVENKLYLNKGDLAFEDITQAAKVGGDNRWVTGVTMGDANQDGWLDIYVSVSGKWTTTKNLLFINDAKEGEVPTFTESAEEYGVADEGNSTQAVFFDYDLDGDQDLYVVNYPIVPSRRSITEFINYRNHAPAHRSDRLYRNEGKGKFSDVTHESGLAKYGLSLGISVGDYNRDGWPDIYVSNDFSTPDYFLINNKDGSFSDQNLNLTNHTSYFGMGTDAADFNNDGLLDIYQVDMMPKGHQRAKENMDSMDPERFYNMVSNDMHHQYSINTLQMNLGNSQGGLPFFGDIARFAGVSSTDWSWASLFADLDNDGQKDLYVTNGVRRDINNSDYFRTEEVKNFETGNSLDLTKKIPSEKIANYAFRNNGDLSFSDVSEEWGLDFKGFSNGVAYADLDNDGDLDLVINNLDDKCTVYKNKTSDSKSNNYLRIKLNGPKSNAFGLGCKIWLEDGKELQFQEVTLTRGFQSSVEPLVHFGVGAKTTIEKLRVLWPDGKEETIHQVAANQVVELSFQNAKTTTAIEKGRTPLFSDITQQAKLDYRHTENNFNDFQYQVLLPHKISQFGPALAVGDINNDGWDDFYIGGANRSPGALFLQHADGTFSEVSTALWEEDKVQEDVGACFFDANKDGLLDLYVVCGGNELREGNPYYQDKFYLNKGNGVFEKNTTALPNMTQSGSTVIAFDYDNDGDEDLFIGGRIVPRKYPNAPKSTILRNESSPSTGIKFTDVTEIIAPSLLDLGMITQAESLDLDGDGYKDLIVVGEWTGITYLKNVKGKFTNQSEAAGLGDTMAWWFGLVSHDFDGDGDQDFMVGNLGKNYKYQAKEGSPFSLYTYDYDNNGKQDIVLSKIEKGKQVPVRGRECSSQQIPAIKTKFKDYHSFATASLEEIYSTDHLKRSAHYEVKNFGHCYVENLGNEQFELHVIKDNFMQLAPINTMVVEDINRDGHSDMIYAGNLYASEVETPRGDSSYGGLMLGNSQGDFKSLKPYESGLFVKGEVKAAKKLKLASGGEGILFAKNNDYLQLVKLNK